MKLEPKHLARAVRGKARAAWAAAQLYFETRRAVLEPDPIFVLGNQKSGTSAIAALLSKASGLSATLDLVREIRDPHFDRVRDGTLSIADFIAINRLEFSRKIVKEPNLTFLYPDLRKRYPQARTVIVVRDPRSNIRSILNRLKLPGMLADLSRAQWDALPAGWSYAVGSQWLGIERGTYIERLAERWNLAADVYLDHSTEMLMVPYERFVRDKVREIHALCDALSVSKSQDISPFVDVQFQPKGDSSVRSEAFFGADNLAKIETICGPRMARLGYAKAT